MPYFSPSTGGFYDEALSGPKDGEGSTIPEDAVAVTEDAHRALLDAQSEGKRIAVAPSGELVATALTATPGQIQGSLSAVVQSMLDAKAKSLGYDSILSASSYADEPAVSSFQAQGAALRAWRSRVWEAAARALAEVQAGTRAVPTPTELLALLPVCGI